jgi:hypothetical protein
MRRALLRLALPAGCGSQEGPWPPRAVGGYDPKSDLPLLRQTYVFDNGFGGLESVLHLGADRVRRL